MVAAIAEQARRLSFYSPRCRQLTNAPAVDLCGGARAARPGGPQPRPSIHDHPARMRMTPTVRLTLSITRGARQAGKAAHPLAHRLLPWQHLSAMSTVRPQKRCSPNFQYSTDCHTSPFLSVCLAGGRRICRLPNSATSS